MKALLYKDYITTRSSMLISLILVSVIGFMTSSQGGFVIIPFVFAYLSIIMNAASFSIERKSDVHKFIFTTPISRKTYIKSKYFLVLISSIISMVSSIFILNYEYGKLNIAIFLSSVLFLTITFINSMQILFILKFGIEKGKIIMFGTYFALFASLNYIVNTLNLKLTFLVNGTLNTYVIILLLLVLSILILYFSQNIGISIINKKEY